MLLIFIPSHDRHSLLLETIQRLDAYYTNLGFTSVKLLCIDSSARRINYSVDFKINLSLQYEHKPGISLDEKFSLVATALRSSNFSWILLNPDDDVFLPSLAALKFITSNQNLGLKFLPSRYLFFRKSAQPSSGPNEDFLECWEGWSQQVHIAESELYMSEKLKNIQ